MALVNRVLSNMKGQSIATGIRGVVAIVIMVTLIPVATTTIASSLGNFTASQAVILGLASLFLVLAVVAIAAKIGGFSITGGR